MRAVNRVAVVKFIFFPFLSFVFLSLADFLGLSILNKCFLALHLVLFREVCKVAVLVFGIFFGCCQCGFSCGEDTNGCRGCPVANTCEIDCHFSVLFFLIPYSLYRHFSVYTLACQQEKKDFLRFFWHMVCWCKYHAKSSFLVLVRHLPYGVS